MIINKIKIGLIFIAIACKGSAANTTYRIYEKNYTVLNKRQESNTIVFLKTFFKWYKTKFEYLDHQIFPVDMDFKSHKPYRINFKETEKYLSVLKSSGFFSDDYIMNTRAYFKAVDEKLKKTKQNDGPVDGLDYDVIVNSQEPESILENLEGLKLTVVKSTANYVAVKMTTKFHQNTHSLYTLKRTGTKYLIDKVDFFMDGVVQKR